LDMSAGRPCGASRSFWRRHGGLRGDPARAVRARQGVRRGLHAGRRELLDEIGEAIIRRPTSPGPSGGHRGLHGHDGRDCYSEREHAVFREGLAKVEQACVSRFGRPFLAATPEERGALAAELDSSVARTRRRRARTSRPLLPHDEGADGPGLLLIGNRLHEGGSLRRVPGRFDADIPYRKGDPAWF